MKLPQMSLIRRLGVLAAGLAAAPALAAAPPPAPAAPDVAQWLTQNTDLGAAQVAIAGPETVYALEPLGPRLATGEVIALVRTESLDAGWGASHGFRSWDAHVLFDCNGGRMRVIRSATYAEPNRKGAPRSERREGGWTTPDPREPAARLFAAACDVTYAWPLRPQTRVAAAAPTPAPSAPAPRLPAPTRPEPQLQAGQAAPAVKAPALAKAGPAAPAASVVVAQAAASKAPAPPIPAPSLPSPPVQPPTDQATPRFAVQIARGPIEAGAQMAIKKARKTLGPAADGLADSTEVSWHGRRRRYTALLSGFASADAARAACATLAKAGQTCLTRDAPDAARPVLAEAATPAPAAPAASVVVAQAAASKASAPPVPSPPVASPPVASPAVQPPADQATPRFAVQVARGPSEAGAHVAIKKAREALGPAAAALADSTEVSWHGRRRRYTALLSGFASADAARAACETLAKAGQTCLTRNAPDAARPVLAEAATPAPATPAQATPAPVAQGRYLVQVARGPNEAGAKRALEAARRTLGPAAANLTAVTETYWVRGRRRYAAVLTGFPSAAEAAQACQTLTSAGQECLTRVASLSAGRERRLALAQLW
jgi:hypothetical protein